MLILVGGLCLLIIISTKLWWDYNDYKNKKHSPKQYIKYKPVLNNYSRIDINRDRYSKRKIPENLDAIIIGSGIGGLSVAAFLSKVGKKVLVEKKSHDS